MYEIIKILSNRAVLVREYNRIKPYSCIYEEQQGTFTEVMNCETEQEKRMLDCYMEGQKMMCENAYYSKGEKKPRCNKINDDRCPLIHYCPITKQYENTSAMFTCVYRGDSDERR